MHKLDHKPDTKTDNKSEPQVGFVFARGLLKKRNASDLGCFGYPHRGLLRVYWDQLLGCALRTEV